MQKAAPASGRDSVSSDSTAGTTSRGDHRPHQDDGNAAKHDDYEVVEVDNEDGDEPQPAKAAPKPPAPSHGRPKLPRLNSQSRAPASSTGIEVRPTASGQEDKSQGHQRAISTGGVPYHIKGSHELPIPKRTSSQSATLRDGGPFQPPKLAAEPTQRKDGAAGPSQPSMSATPRIKPSLKEKDEEDGENPTIQIAKVTPVSSGLTLPPNLAELAEGMEDKYVDEFGNVLEWDGRVLGRVEGDLPSMIGRPVAATGEIFSDSGEVVGYVAENEALAARPPSPQPILGMGDGLRVDHLGNILNKNNKIVGHFDPDHLSQNTNQAGSKNNSQRQQSNPHGNGPSECSCQVPLGPKPTAAPSPSEIYLDVKSTNDGVQLIIKIPTVFNGGGNPNIHIGLSE